MTIGRIAAIGLALFGAFISFSSGAVVESPKNCECGCGFGFEILLAKLESIEEKLEALQKWQNNGGAQPKPPDGSNHIEDVTTVIQSVEKTKQIISAKVTIEDGPKTQLEDGQKKANLPIGIDPTEEQLPFSEDQIYGSCREVSSKISGKFLIRLKDNEDPMNLFCEMQMLNGGWIVVQNRFNGSESFYRNWNDYRTGFGNLDGEFWLGLERISSIVNDGRRWEIMFWLTTFSRLVRYAKFDNFSLGKATDAYTLKQVGKYLGNAGDSIYTHVGMKFSTFDKDNDAVPYNCAKKHRGGWWYRASYGSNLNGVYGNVASEQSNNWPTISGPSTQGLLASKIMIREMV